VSFKFLPDFILKGIWNSSLKKMPNQKH
jgi:hypothetical protein